MRRSVNHFAPPDEVPEREGARGSLLPDVRRSGPVSRARFWLVVEIACLLILGILVAVIGRRLASNAVIRAEERASTDVMAATAEPLTAETVETEETAEYRPPAEFESLLLQNSDFVGMVSFQDKSLYVCQTYNNQFYMNHKFDGSEDVAGMIFMDCRCQLNPRSDNLILYGHNMKDGARFGTLNRYEKQSYLEQYPRFRFDGLEAGGEYLPIAVFHVSVDEESDDYFDFMQFDFVDEQAFNGYISAVRARSLYSIDIDVAYGEKLLTLATCTSELEDGRLVIVCRAAREGE